MNSAYFLRFVIMLSLIINAAGELYFYQLYRFGFQFDKFAHLANSLLFILALASYGRTRYGLVPMKSLKISVVIVIICGLGWEVGEFASDKFFQTKEFGIYGQLKAIDTIFDIIYDFLGITLAAIMEKSFRFRLRSEVALCEGSPPA
ncbi:hypothetical protein HGA34_00985 [Candidatus Falkowbacteria bacterium]|nr:hypothetical protein [Candidatus Falkowbacteria bacterium]